MKYPIKSILKAAAMFGASATLKLCIVVVEQATIARKAVQQTTAR